MVANLRSKISKKITSNEDKFYFKSATVIEYLAKLHVRDIQFCHAK